MLKGKKILIGITASIAAYKTISLVRLLVQAGAEVKVILTPAAKDFVSPVVLSTLSKNEVLADIANEIAWNNHVMLGRWADVFLIAPLSCNTLAKMANGQCDNLLLAVYLSSTCPVVCAPAMDEDMWKHPATVKNLDAIKSYGNEVISVTHGELASGLIGEGRMAEPQDICNYLFVRLTATEELKGKKVLVTAGPTYEKMDPVRFIGNFSSGKMGFAIAEAFVLKGATVTLITGPTALSANPLINRIDVQTADEMYNAVLAAFSSADIAVMSAAVADYKPQTIASNKIKKSGDTFAVEMVKTVDILQSLGAVKKTNQVLVGFALETEHEEVNAVQKLKNKNADLIVLNSLNDEGAGFAKDTNKITIFDKEGVVFKSDVLSKTVLAGEIVKIITTYV